MLDLAGRGYGHGRGMSQCGGIEQRPPDPPIVRPGGRIKAYYLTGTVLSQAADETVRVRLDQVGTGPTTVAAGGGLTLKAASCTIVPKTTSSLSTYWRVRRASATTFTFELLNCSRT